MLWPYALRYVNDVVNATPNKGEEIIPLQKFSSVSVAPKLRHFHSFGCPAYVLDNALQSSQGLPKGHQGPDLEYTLVHPQIMQDQWH